MNKPREKTIDSYGNIAPKPYGVSRWEYPKRYACEHEECLNKAVFLNPTPTAHNCCGQHVEGSV